jgi:hypothetical protein
MRYINDEQDSNKYRICDLYNLTILFIHHIHNIIHHIIHNRVVVKI